jgi:ATP synthase protein I
MTTDRVTPLIRGALKPTLAVAAVAIALSAVLSGTRGLVGAALGAFVVVSFSGAGLLALRMVRQSYPEVVLLVAVASYFLRVLIFGGLLAVVGSLEIVDVVIERMATSLTVIACVAAWCTGEIRAFVRLRVPLYDLDQRRTSATGATESAGNGATELTGNGATGSAGSTGSTGGMDSTDVAPSATPDDAPSGRSS